MGELRQTWRVQLVGAALADGGWMTAMQVWRAAHCGGSYATVRAILGKLEEHRLAESEPVNRLTPTKGRRWRATPPGLVWGEQARKAIARGAGRA
jgi:hypothetical protein